jgi:amino acid adenylation domain-containing protein/non-ribosomal peptide synthase protein (TIGR01720 family)
VNSPLSRTDRIAALPKQAQELLRRRLAGQAAPVESIARADRGGPLPSSFAQRSLWFLNEFEPGGSEYNTAIGLRMTGKLDLPALRTALRQLVARHEALRTTFPAVDTQEIQPEAEVELVQRDGDLERLLAEEAVRPFDLANGPLLRAMLVTLGQEEHVLTLSMHHIITDGWSVGVLTRDFGALYTAAVSGVDAELPELPLQFADFAQWQREQDFDAQLGHWREVLAGLSPLEMPTDRPRPPVRSSAGAVHWFDISPQTTAGLHALSRAKGATLFMTLTAATQLLLARYSGQDDIAIGTVVSGRGRSEWEDVAGFFVNTVVIRSTVDPELPFGGFLSSVRQNVLDAFTHDDIPFERIVEELAPERDTSTTPLVQASITLQNAPAMSFALPGLEVEPFPLPRTNATRDLSVEFTESGGGLRASLEYSTDLFDATTAQRLAANLTHLLDEIVADSDRPLGQLPVRSDAERRLVESLNDTAVDRGAARCVHEIFAEQAARTPNATAVYFDGEALSFAALEASANRLAHYLVRKGVGPDVLVGLCVERDLNTLVAILGIQKAGGAYVPLDPKYPADRIEFMLADSAVPVVVTHRGMLPELDGAVRLDDDCMAIATCPSTPPKTAVTPDNLAYVIYTSGSTGKPKGVQIEHRNLQYIAHAWDLRYGLTERKQRFVSVSSLSVDLFYADFLRSTLFGGTLVICPAELTTEPAALLDLIEQTAATGLELVPTLAAALVAEAQRRGHGLASLRLLSVGSEGWRVEDCRELLRAVSPDAIVVNAYGGTEATVDSTVFQPSPETLTGQAFVPIGRPLANTTIQLLDRWGQPVPVGVPGEVFIGGDGVARGYHNRPELTAERFVQDADGTRWYRTGDLARLLPTGDLEFLGRADDQVKIRGFRVELGEVEGALAAHPDVAEVAVVARRDDSIQRLVAYLVPRSSTPNTAELRAFLSGRLPDYMVPAIFMTLAALPTTPSGKVDRKALPAPEGRPELATAYVAPGTEQEQILVRAWADVLHLPKVGVHDNFFELGGDSILSIQVVAKARADGLGVSTKDIFTHQTIRELAGVVTTATVRSDQHEITGEVVLTPIQRWFFDEYDVHPEHYSMSFHVELADGVDVQALRRAVTTLAAQHDALRMRFRFDGGWRQENAPVTGAEALTEEHLGDRTIDELALSVQAGMNLADGPLFKAVLVHTDARPRLLIVVHHLVVDGVSWRILLEDLETAYQGGSLGPKTTSFQQWAARLDELVQAGHFDAGLDYWATADPGSVPGLPVDATGVNTAGSAEVVTVELSPQDTAALLHDVPAAYHTRINDILLSAVGRVFADWTGHDRVAVGMEGHGREHIGDDLDVSRTVSWFTTHFPVLLDIPDGDWGRLVKSVKEQLRAVPGNGIGYDALKYGVPGSVLREHPLPQLSFNYLGQFDAVAAGSPLYHAHLPNAGQDHHPDQLRPYLLDVVCVAEAGRLVFTWVYSADIHQRATIERLAARLADVLTEIIEHCTRPGAGGHTPSDFPLAGLTQSELDTMALGDVADIYPLTPMQAGMLFHSLVEADAGTYFEQMSFVLDGIGDPRALGQAWQRVVDHTPILRTSLRWQGVREPLQIVHRSAQVPVRFLDWSGSPDQEELLRQLLAEDRALGIDLTIAPLMRLVIIDLGDDQVRVVRTSHHVLLDGWSTSHVLADLFAAYRAIVDGSEPELPARRPFRDYVGWLAQQDQTAAQRHWRSVMAGITAPTELPCDRRPADSHTARSTRRHHVQLTPAESAELFATLKKHRLTVNTAVQGAWALLLSRYSGVNDVVFGATASGRPADLPGADSIVGNFINTLPVRVEVDPAGGVADWLALLQQRQASSRQFEFVSLAQLRTWSDLPSSSNVFDSIVVFENFPVDHESARRQNIEVVGFDAEEATNYPLSLVAHAADTLSLVLNYDPDLFDEGTTQAMATHLVTLLRGIAAQPEQQITGLSMVSDAERERFTVEYNDTTVPEPGWQALHEIFAEQARRTPDEIAVVAGERTLTFAALDKRANQLARYLRDNGVGPDVMVGLATDRTLELVVGLLGILKAGGAYVPLDPAYPADRLEYMAQTASVRLVLTQDSLTDQLPLAGRQIFRLDADWSRIARRSAKAPAITVHPDNLAYIVFTSGSTGRPKGVQVLHRGVTNLCRHHGKEVFARAADLAGRRVRVAHTASISFDATMNQLIGMINGGEFHVIGERTRRDAHALVDYVRDRGIDFLSVTPTYLQRLVDLGVLDGPGHRPNSVLLGGEGSGPGLWTTLRGYPDVTTHNYYAPSECTVDAVGATADQSETPRIGRPMRNTQVYVLDERLRPAAAGVAGEIYLAGESLGRGYLTRPDLTAERFVASPFAAGVRMYRTGDVGRWRSDGLLEHLGRADDQVKIRGYRIEPAEVEARMLAHPAVRQAVVVAREDQAGRRLIGYLVPDGPVPTTTELRAFLAERLPDFMVPAVFVTLEELPLTPSGKVARRALPAPEARPELDAGYVAPRDEFEQVLAGIFGEVLGLDRVGVHDNFFELGGDSILTIQVVSRVRSLMAVELSPRVVFDTPDIAGLARVAVKARTGSVAAGPVAVPRDSVPSDSGPPQRFPLSFAQQRLWFLDEFAPGNVEYNTGTGLRLVGALDIPALTRSLAGLVERHESLRTTFESFGGEGVQVVHPPHDVPLALTDVSKLPEADRERMVADVMADEMATAFDLTSGPMLRARLIRLAAEEHLLVLGMHHIVTDGWSMSVLADELGERYAAATEGRAVDLAELPVQYADYTLWQRERLAGAEFAAKLEHWTTRLAGLSPLDIPTDRPRPAVKTANGAVHRFEVSAQRLAALTELSLRHGTTLFMTLLAATKVLLARYSGQDDIAVGTVTSGRDHAELERLVGFFVNTVVIRSQVDADESFEALLAKVKDNTLDAFAHADVPFERLVDAVAPERDPSRTPLVQACVVLQNTPRAEVKLGDLRIDPVPLPASSAVFDVSVEFGVRGDGLAGLLEYNTDLFDAGTAERLAEQLLVVLDAIVANAATPVGDLPALTEQQRNSLLTEWNDAEQRPVPQLCVHDLVDAQATRTPDAIAITCDGVALTYAELVTRTNQLANHLVERGVGPDTLVAISVERGLEMVVGLLGILKAGGAYVPLDPAYPSDRLAFMLADTEARIVLSQSGVELPAGAAEVIRLDTDWPDIARQPVDRPETGVGPDNLAYVIYTSGSTGKPKGVLVEHRNVLNLLANTGPRFGFGPRDVWTMFHSYAFDFSVWELWGGLAFGGRVVVVPRSVARSPEQMWQLLQSEGVTVLNQTPSSFRELVRTAVENDEPVPDRLRVVIFGGEGLEPKHVRGWFENYTGARLVNMYGITETCVHVTYEELDWAEIQARGRVSIGRPIANYTAYLLDPRGAIAPPGAPGELYIGGAGLARGYLNRPELTGERFHAVDGIADRLYRTGDVARIRPDGRLDYLGRADDQVKIRGFRIELGEIESVLTAHPLIAEAAVLARENRLVAYVVPRAELPDVQELRVFAGRTLPEYMVPAVIVELDGLPLTPSGKLDRRALPEPSAQVALDGFVAPRTETERLLVAAWIEVLGVDKAGVHDNFFELGGDSILSIQAVSAARRLGVHVSTKDMFAHQTVAELAEVAATETECADGVSPVGELPLTPIQHWFFERHPVFPDHFGMSVHLELAGGVDPEVLRQALAALVEHHDALRSRFARVNGRWQHRVLAEDVVHLSVVDSAFSESEVRKAQNGMSLTTGPLLHAVLFTGSLFIAAHHTVIDGVSWRIVLEDLALAYKQLAGGQPVDLGRKTSPYREWAQKLAEHVEAGALDHELEHWRAVPDVPIPADGHGSNTVASAETMTTRLTRQQTEVLLRQVPGRYRTQINDILLGALAVAVSRWSGHGEVVVDVEGHGREDLFDDVDLSRTVGWFTTIYPVALRVPAGPPDWRALSRAVKTQLRAVPGKGLGYGALRYLGGHPLGEHRGAQISFNYLGQWDDSSSGGELFGRQLPSAGDDHAPAEARSHLIDVVGAVHGGELELTWIYSTQVHSAATIRKLADDVVTLVEQAL